MLKPGYKRCIKCLEAKPPDEFYAHKKMADGRLNKCKECQKADVRGNYRKDLEESRRAERKRNRTPRRRAQLSAASRRHRQANPQRYKARTALNNAVRDGRIVKGPCEECGTAERVEGHHADYSNPLEVTWLCRPCHRAQEGTRIIQVRHGGRRPEM